MTAPQDPDEFSDPVYRDPTAGDYYSDDTRTSTPVPPPVAPPQPPPVPVYRPEPFQPEPYRPEPVQPEPVQPEPVRPEPVPSQRGPSAPVPPATWLPQGDQHGSGTWNTGSATAPPPAPPQYPARYPGSPGGYGPGRPYPRQYGTRRRRGGKTGCIIPVVVVAFIIVFNVATGFGKLFNRDSSDGSGSRYTPPPSSGISTSVENYYLAAGGGYTDRAENYICQKDRSTWRANAKQAGVDSTRPVREAVTTSPTRSGDGYDTTATVTYMTGTTATRTLHLVKESDLYRICGGLI